MSQLGYIQKSYGKEIKIAAANTYAYNVINGSNLPSNTLIIASPTDVNREDTGSYSLLITDYISNPVRLTYTLREGSGIIYSDDSLKVQLDNKTIIERNKEITANVSELIDNDKIIYNNDKVYLNIDNFERATVRSKGVYTIDENTIKNADDTLYVDTSKLRYADEETETAGTFIGDGKLINVENGIISLKQELLHKADDTSFGTILGDNNTIKIEEGIISVNTDGLNRCNETPGIVTSDNSTINFNTNLELIVNEDNLDKGNSSANGVIKYDPATFDIKDDTLKVKNFSKFNTLISEFNDKTYKVDDIINDINYLLEEYQVSLQKPEITDFYCASLLTGVLEKPWYLNQGIDEMPMQFITADFMITTNCPFIISIKYEDNINPAFALYQINYNSVVNYNGNAGLTEVFQTTKGEKVPIKITFIGKNYYKEDKTEYSNKVKIKIIVSYANDVSINKSLIYSIVRFNSAYNEEIEYDETNLETYIKKGTN